MSINFKIGEENLFLKPRNIITTETNQTVEGVRVFHEGDDEGETDPYVLHGDGGTIHWQNDNWVEVQPQVDEGPNHIHLRNLYNGEPMSNYFLIFSDERFEFLSNKLLSVNINTQNNRHRVDMGNTQHFIQGTYTHNVNMIFMLSTQEITMLYQLLNEENLSVDASVRNVNDNFTDNPTGTTQMLTGLRVNTISNARVVDYEDYRTVTDVSVSFTCENITLF